jgi:hypothetical protein
VICYCPKSKYRNINMYFFSPGSISYLPSLYCTKLVILFSFFMVLRFCPLPFLHSTTPSVIKQTQPSDTKKLLTQHFTTDFICSDIKNIFQLGRSSKTLITFLISINGWTLDFTPSRFDCERNKCTAYRTEIFSTSLLQWQRHKQSISSQATYQKSWQ